MINREDAFKLIQEHCDFALQRHLVHVATAMQAMAKFMNHEEALDIWYITGLLHDIDWNRTISKPQEHCGEDAMKLLEDNDVSVEIREAIQSHYDYLQISRDTDLKKAIFCCDEISGFCVAVSLMRPTKMIGMEPKSVIKKMKDKRFAEAVSRDDMKACETLLNIPVNEFLAILLPAFGEIAAQWKLA